MAEWAAAGVRWCGVRIAFCLASAALCFIDGLMTAKLGAFTCNGRVCGTLKVMPLSGASERFSSWSFSVLAALLTYLAAGQCQFGFLEAGTRRHSS